MKASLSPNRKPATARGVAAFACAACGQPWLVAGLEPGEMYTCKSCGHRFRADLGDAPTRADRSPCQGPQRARDGVRRSEGRVSSGRAPEERHR
jgi:hypothetical protein